MVVEALLFDELPEPFNEIKMGRVGGHIEQLNAQALEELPDSVQSAADTGAISNNGGSFFDASWRMIPEISGAGCFRIRR